MFFSDTYFSKRTWLVTLLISSSLIFLVFLTFFSKSILFTTFVIQYTSIWSLFYFSLILYGLFVICSLLYLLPNISFFSGANNFNKPASFISLDGLTLFRVSITFLILLFITHISWVSPAISSWFGHLVFSTFQYKITFMSLIFFSTYLFILSSVSHYSSTNSYDFTATIISFFVWLWLMTFSTNLFTFIFFLELLSVLTLLLLITSSFSSLYFYNNTSYSSHSYFSQSLPTAFFQTVLFIFWITLLSSLLLFIFLTFLYLKVFTFDWSLIDTIFLFVVNTASLKTVFGLSISWLLFIITVFIKCGVVPFYLWKPTFFKGMPIIALFFYVYVYYYLLFFYFLYVMVFLANEIFLANLYLMATLIASALIMLTTILFESFYLKSFLALSSILNSTFVLLALTGQSSSDLIFFF